MFKLLVNESINGPEIIIEIIYITQTCMRLYAEVNLVSIGWKVKTCLDIDLTQVCGRLVESDPRAFVI